MPGRFLLVSANRCATPDPVFPIGLSFLNAALRRADYATRWLDLHSEPDSLDEVLRSFQPDYVGISLRNIDDILIRTRETFYDGVGAACALIKRVSACPVILGGSGFTLFPVELLRESGADFGIQGEGEAGLLALLTALEKGNPTSDIPGLVYRHGERIVTNPVRLEALRGGFSPEDRPPAVTAHYLRAAGMLNVQTQRGCAHHCCYCTYPLIEGHEPRRRAPEAVAEELAQAQAAGARYVFIVDSIFNSSPEHVVETCEVIIRRQVQLHWGCFLRPEGLTRELMTLMVRAGLAHIEFGSDSFCDSVLHAYGKRFTFDDILKSSQLAHAAGVEQCHFLICGGPGETAGTLRTSFKHSQALPGAVITAVVGMRIYPRTALFRRALQEGLVEAGTDLLKPVYYVAPGLTVDGLFAQLRELAASAPNWIVGDVTPESLDLVRRLRQRGVVGPAWSYLATLQRITAPAR